VVRALYKYDPSVITATAATTDADNDLPFNKGDHMIVIREYVRPSVCLSVCLLHTVMLPAVNYCVIKE